MGTNLIRSPIRPISVLIRSVIHTVFALCWKGKKQLASHRYIIHDVLSINSRDFDHYPGQLYPLSLRLKTRQRATPLLPTSIVEVPEMRISHSR